MDRPSSMVKRSRDQSHEAPSRFSWLKIMPPDSAFHSQTFSMKSSRVRSRRWICFSISWRSTTICVAMPAWSMPGCHSTFLPRMRSKRTRMSCSVLLSAWPICSEPVTFGGGMTMVKASAPASAPAPARKRVGLFPDFGDLRLDGFCVVGFFKHGKAVRAVGICSVRCKSEGCWPSQPRGGRRAGSPAIQIDRTRSQAMPLPRP